MAKNLPATRDTWVQSLDWEDSLEKEMATHSSTPAWRIPWTEKRDRQQSMGSQTVGHDWETNTFVFSPKQTRRKGVCLCGDSRGLGERAGEGDEEGRKAKSRCIGDWVTTVGIGLRLGPSTFILWGLSERCRCMGRTVVASGARKLSCLSTKVRSSLAVDCFQEY